MAKYQTKVEQVEAAKLDGSTDYTNTDGTVVPAGSFLIRHSDGRVSTLPADQFEASFEAVAETPAGDTTTSPVTDPATVDAAAATGA